ncbi:hypothetical protein ABPG72_006211 [Tetrahymena utriculariae]
MFNQKIFISKQVTNGYQISIRTSRRKEKKKEKNEGKLKISSQNKQNKQQNSQNFDYVVDSLNALANKFGDDGYLLYGFLSQTGIFIAMTSLQFIPSVDWSLCFILRGVAYYLFGMMCAAIYKSDISFCGNSFDYTNVRNILMGFYQLFLQYMMVLLPVSII